MAGYYDPNKDYSSAIESAKNNGASASEINRLQQERQNKINGKYGGHEPNMIGSDKTYSETHGGGSRRPGSSTPIQQGAGFVNGGYTIGANGIPVLGDNPYWNKDFTGGPLDGSRRPDLAGQVAVDGGYTTWYDDNGYAVKSIKGAVDYLPTRDPYAGNGHTDRIWTDENNLTTQDLGRIQSLRNQAKAGQISWDQASQEANRIRAGYGYTVDKQGNITDLNLAGLAAARRNQWGIQGPGMSAESEAWLQQVYPGGLPGIHGGGPGGIPGGAYGYGSFDDYLDAMGYDRVEDATRDAIKASVAQAVGGLNDQIGQTNRQSEEAARQAYIGKMLGQKNLDQQLSAEGYAGGMADSQRIATETAYQNQVNDLQMQRMETIGQLQRAIENAEFAGDMQAAQELAQYLQAMQGQYAAYVQNQQAMAREDAWRRQDMAREDAWRQQDITREDAWRQQQLQEENKAMAYERASALLQMGIMPNPELLAAAGIDANTAGRVRQTVLAAQAPGGSSGGGSRRSSGRSSRRRSSSSHRSSGGGYNNGGLSADQVMQMQKALGVTPDGMWGHDSYAASGGLSADQAWAKHEAASKDSWKADKNGPGGWVMVPGYGRMTWQELKKLVDAGYVKETVDKSGRHSYRKV